MLKKKSKYILIALLALLMFFGLSSASDNRSHSVKADDITVVPPKTPSPDPLNGLIFTWRTGYSLQPQSQYTYRGEPVSMYTKLDMTWLDWSAGLLYSHEWWQSTDGKNWSKVKNATSNSLTVTPTQVGTVYYQKFYVNRVPIVGTILNGWYSKVATITTVPDPINATGVAVSVDDNYLYNNQSKATTTYAHATPIPFNATAKTTWSIDNTDLATIDPNTGEVTANTKGKSGKVTVTATLTNHDTSSVQGHETIDIGGGLDDQEVDEGQKATFKVLGNWPQAPTSVVWHKVVNGVDTTVSSGTSMSYTTPDTAYSDNNTQYYAVLQVPSDGSSTSSTITTNKAKLTVNANTEPNIKITNTVYNNTYDDHNSDDTIINGVMGGDKLVMKGTITDTNANSVMTAAGFRIRIPINMAPSSVKIDGEEYGGYVVDSVQGDDTVADIAITNLDFSKTKTHTYEIAIDAGYNNNLQFVTTPTLYGQTADESNLPDPYTGNPLGINFSDGELNVKAHDIDYGQLKYSNVGTAVDGSVDGTNNNDKNLLTVNDNRRDKTATQIFLAQTTPFSDGSNTLASELRYYNGSNYTTLTKDGIPISSAANGSALNSVGNNATDGLKLYMYNSAIKYGSYSSTLSWTVVNAPE
ncbi:hypothetical protein [Companilactobacillus sp.]|uniref:hypothetical protein n=1 Tax=Companilactobacillus sp. TaxID=2767905 RepID=UPI002628D5A9|nr:hypothetical protein [Companilactobacillus sp.]